MSAPPRTAYARGRKLEYRVRDELLAAGYQLIRGAGSKGDGDLWAVKSRGFHGLVFLLFVQVKRRTADFSVAEWNELLAAAESCHGSAILATARPRGEVFYFRLCEPRIPRSRRRPWEVFTP